MYCVQSVGGVTQIKLALCSQGEGKLRLLLTLLKAAFVPTTGRPRLLITELVIGVSLTSGPCDHADILDAICRATVSKHVVLDGARTSVSTQQPSEQGYLNLTSPMVTLTSTKGSEETSDGKDQG